MELNQECILLQTELRKFAQQVILDKVDEFDKSCSVPSDNVTQLAEMGILGATIPEDMGGAALDTIGLVVSLEEISKVCPSTALIVAIHNAFAFAIAKFGSDDMRKKYLEKAASGEIIGGFATTSANELRVEHKNGSMILNGSNSLILNADMHGPFILFVPIDNEKKNLAACIIDRDLSGMKIHKNDTALGLKAAGIGNASFENSSITNASIVGAEHDGYKVHNAGCDLLNIYLAAIACGLAQGATDAAINYAKERVQFGQPIVTFGMIREKIADMATRIEAGRLLTYNAALARDAGKSCSHAASVAKYYMGRAAVDTANAAIQIFGGYGYMKDYPVERLFRDAQVINVLCNTPAEEKERIAKETIG
jgi:alkylation response protein AidB-like acyl-CoA dehydrogenase